MWSAVVGLFGGGRGSAAAVVADAPPPEVAAPLSPPPDGLLSLRQRLIDASVPTVPKRPLNAQLPAIRAVPKEIWDLVLQYLSARDAMAFSATCSLFHATLESSRVWPLLLDGRFGRGLSRCLAQSRVILEAALDHKLVSDGDIVAARENFYRRARLEFLRLHFLRLFSESALDPETGKWRRVFPRGVCGEADMQTNQGQLYWGAAVVTIDGKERVCIIVAPHIFAAEKSAKFPLPRLDWVRLKPVFYQTVPVVPFECFQKEKLCNITVRCFNSADSIVLSAAVQK